MANVGVIGLGNIGGAIAQNLVADGHDVLVSDLSADAVAAIEGAKGGSVEDVAAHAEVTFTSLPDPATVTAIATQWAAAAPAGAVLCDMSTTLPESNRAIAAQLQSTGHFFVEAPLTGGHVGAVGRMLVFLVGGDDEAVAKVTPLLEKLGRATFHLGAVGTGTTMKLANSLLAFSSAVASLEALSLTTKAGIDVRTAVTAIRTAGAGNYYIDRAVEGINNRGKPAEFSLRLAAKDASLITEIAAATDLPAPVGAAMAEVFGDAVTRGLGDNDWTDLVAVLEARGNVELTIAPAPEA